MMIVVCKKFRLIEKSKGKFTTEHKKEIRSKLKLDDQYVKVQNKISGITGIYYEVDEKATKERLEIIESKKTPVSDNGKNGELEALKQRATDLGIEFHGRSGIEKLTELIDAKLLEMQGEQ